MAIKVSVPGTKKIVSTAVTGTTRVTSAKLEQLANVDISGGLENGYTLVYDEDTGKFVAQEISSQVQNLDGGSY